MTSSRFVLGLVLLGSGVALGGACSGASGEAGGGKGGGAAAAGAGGDTDSAAGTGGGGTGGDGGTGGMGGGDEQLFPDLFVPDQTGTPDSCADTEAKAEKIPVDLYFMLDQSGSMLTANKWTAVTTAFKQFVDNPQTVGLGVGIQYFPLPQECDITAYAAPEVPIAVLPGNAAPFKASLAAHAPTGGTPTKPALQGAINYAKSFALNNPTHKVFVVLATDGDPNVCSSTPAAVAAICGAAATGVPKIQVFVIGMLTPNDPGAVNTANLNQWADLGDDGQPNSSAKAFLVDASVPQQFIDALLKIQGTAIGCEYKIPQTDGGVPIDKDKVNVDYIDGNGQPNSFGVVDDKSKCTAKAWYYEPDKANATKIVLCPDACKTVQADPKATVKIKFGCTISKPPPA